MFLLNIMIWKLFNFFIHSIDTFDLIVLRYVNLKFGSFFYFLALIYINEIYKIDAERVPQQKRIYKK